MRGTKGQAPFEWIRSGEKATSRYSVYADVLIDGLRQLSDRRLQEGAWLSPFDPRSPDEALSAFDDSGMSVVLDDRRSGPPASELLGPELVSALVSVLDAASSANLGRPRYEAIQSPGMDHLRRVADSALRLVEQQVGREPRADDF